MTRNCALIQRLHGQETIFPALATAEETIGDFLALELAGRTVLVEEF